MIFEIAWKNIWRNKLRSGVVIAAIAIGLIAGIFSVAIMNGALLDRVDIAIRNEISSIQIHKPEFITNGEPGELIKSSDSIMNIIRKYDEVEAVCGRLKIEAMVNSGHGPRGVMVVGIQPEIEKTVTGIYSTISDSSGTYFETDLRNPIVISSRLAEKLKSHLNSKIQIDAVSKTGEPISAIFRIVGIYNTDNSMFDEMNAFVQISDLQRVFEFKKDEVHEIAILTKDIMETDSLDLNLKKEFTRYVVDSVAILTLQNSGLEQNIISYFKSIQSDKEYKYDEFNNLILKNVNSEDFSKTKDIILTACEDQIDVMSWGKLSPDLELTTVWMDMLLFMFVGIILLALGFGIVNTMLMVVLERVKELGMLMAIGMNRRRVYFMVVIETVVLSLVGGIIGIVISSALIAWLGSVGINISSMSEGLNAMGYSTLIYPSIDLNSYIEVVIMVIITGILSALYPAWKAIRLNPADAIRSE